VGCYGYCEPPNNCVTTGCSGQICAAEPVNSTCEWLEWYTCLELTQCGPYGIGDTCMWEENDACLQCLGSYSISDTGVDNHYIHNRDCGTHDSLS
jgi:eight-cysteine-cluster-containing protein